MYPSDMLKRLEAWFSARARRRRGLWLRQAVDIDPDARILDLGGGDGSHIKRIFPHHVNITVSDISEEALCRARAQYGFTGVKLSGLGLLPFAHHEFDFCFCSSVIEHVTGPKDDICRISDGAKFKEVAWSHQQTFAREINRIAKSYYVQTPYPYFIIESHTWLPVIIVFLPRRWQIALIAAFNKFWPKKTIPDWNLLSYAQMEQLFPNARIFREKFLFLTKSLMVIKN